MPALSTNGVKLTYETLGDPNGEPVLLIMGLGMQLTGWPDQFCQGLVDQGFLVIRYDNRDAGLSTMLDQHGTPNLAIAFAKAMLHLPISSGYRLDDMARDAVGILTGLGIEKAHVVGASMGGMIAQIMAATFPHRVLSLTSIMSTSGRRRLPGPTVAARRVLLSRPDNLKDMNSVVSHFVKVFQTIGSPRYPTPEAILREQIAASVARSLSPAGTARQLLAITASGDRVALLKKMRVPTLVIHGDSDPLILPACGRDVAALVPGARLELIEGMGHDFPAALTERLVEMIAGHCRRTALPDTKDRTASGISAATHPAAPAGPLS